MTQVPTPQLLIKEINDTYAQSNFKNLRDYFNKQSQLLNFNFVEFSFSGAVANQKIAHGLGLIPQDVIVTRITGAGTATLNWSLFDSSNLDITTTGACRIRLFVGSYWNFQSAVGNLTGDSQSVQATPSTSTTSTSTSGTTTSTATVTTTITTTAAIYAPPSIQRFTATGAGTYNLDYTFIISSGSATALTTYTINGVTYTVTSTVVNATQIVLSGSVAPPASGVLTAGGVGSGDSFLTYSQVLTPIYLRARIVGGGGGGSGGSTIAATNGGTGTSGLASNFGGPTVAQAGGGSGSAQLGVGAGGTNVLSGPIAVINLAGAAGTSTIPGNSTASATGTPGASSYMGGAGAGGSNLVGGAGVANSGSGGAGGGGPASGYAGSGGGAGGYLEVLIYNPALTYALSVGTGGPGGLAGTSGQTGGAGGSGIVIVEAYYR